MQSKNPKLLTVCIPTYNRSYFLDETLASICAQLDDSILNAVNIVISDNDSKDDTGDIVKRYMSKYPENIRYFKNEENIGAIKNVVGVTDHADGEYLWLLSDDDCATDFSLKYILEIIGKVEFDLMLCKSKPFEQLPVSVEKQDNTFRSFNGIKYFIDYLYDEKVPYMELNSYFSFYSVIIVRREFFSNSKPKINHEFEKTNFPHSYVIYSHPEIRVVVPDNVFVLGRTMNEGYSCSVKLIRDFEQVFDLIEETNGLGRDMNWLSIKSKCIYAWRTNMYLGMVLKKLGLDYKRNPFLKKIYFMYRRVLGVFFNT